MISDLEDVQLDTTDVRSILDKAQVHQRQLDGITLPKLLHRDLWNVNTLVKQSGESPRIAAVLDSDRISWGDPRADWTMFLLHCNASTEVDAFWETSGQPARCLGAQFRKLIYQARYIGGARLEHHPLQHHETVKRSYRDVQAVIEALRSLLITLPSSCCAAFCEWMLLVAVLSRGNHEYFLYGNSHKG
jgi:fructosamine-3-kinase